MDFARLNLLLGMIVIIGLNAESASAQTGLGKSCSVAANCTGVANTTCSNKTCVCVASFKVSGTTCVPKVLGDNCTDKTDCASVKNSTCDKSSNKCACAATHKEMSGQCQIKVPVIGKSCSSPTDSVCTLPNSSCDTSSSKCACNTGFYNKNDQCLAVLGKTCSLPADCAEVANTTCSITTCVCVASFKVSGVKCAPKIIGAACTSSNKACTLQNSSCDISSSKCACKTGFYNKNDRCLAVLGKTCSLPADCAEVANTTCSNTTCVCVASFKVSGVKCAPKIIGTSCSNATKACTLLNSSCDQTSSKCACNTGFHDKNDKCLADNLDSSADTQRLAFSIFAASLMLTVQKTL